MSSAEQLHSSPENEGASAVRLFKPAVPLSLLDQVCVEEKPGDTPGVSSYLAHITGDGATFDVRPHRLPDGLDVGGLPPHIIENIHVLYSACCEGLRMLFLRSSDAPGEAAKVAGATVRCAIEQYRASVVAHGIDDVES